MSEQWSDVNLLKWVWREEDDSTWLFGEEVVTVLQHIFPQKEVEKDETAVEATEGGEEGITEEVDIEALERSIHQFLKISIITDSLGQCVRWANSVNITGEKVVEILRCVLILLKSVSISQEKDKWVSDLESWSLARASDDNWENSDVSNVVRYVAVLVIRYGHLWKCVLSGSVISPQSYAVEREVCFPLAPIPLSKMESEEELIRRKELEKEERLRQEAEAAVDAKREQEEADAEIHGDVADAVREIKVQLQTWIDGRHEELLSRIERIQQAIEKK